jgi:hypothetical protein
MVLSDRKTVPEKRDPAGFIPCQQAHAQKGFDTNPPAQDSVFLNENKQ